MSQTSSQTNSQTSNVAYDKLLAMENAIRARQPVLPLSDEAKLSWSGIGFSLNNCLYAAPINEVAEIVEIPRLTQVPGVCDWVKGVANVRGRLVPVLDLMQFFFAQQSQVHTKQQRLLILEHHDVCTGVIVDGVSGMQHFPENSFLPRIRIKDDCIMPFVAGGYLEAPQRVWPVFSLLRLLDDQRFMKLEWVELSKVD